MTIACNQVMLDILKNTLVELPDTGIVVYVGGGHGNVLFEFLKEKPELTGIIYEMPAVRRGAQKPVQRLGLFKVPRRR